MRTIYSKGNFKIILANWLSNLEIMEEMFQLGYIFDYPQTAATIAHAHAKSFFSIACRSRNLVMVEWLFNHGVSLESIKMKSNAYRCFHIQIHILY